MTSTVPFFYYDLNSQTRVCSCHCTTACPTIPAENKAESSLIWSLVNFSGTNRKEVKKGLTKWLKNVKPPAINILYKIKGYHLEVEGAAMIHICYILENPCITVLLNIPSASNHLTIEARSIRIIHISPDGKHWVCTEIENAIPILAALSFAFIRELRDKDLMNGATAIKYKELITSMEKRSLGPDFVITHKDKLTQYMPIAASFNLLIQDWISSSGEKPDEKMVAARSVLQKIIALSVTAKREDYLEIQDQIVKDNLMGRKTWFGLLTDRLSLRLQDLADNFWELTGQKRNDQYEHFCDMLVFKFSNSFSDANIITGFFIPDLNEFLSSIVCCTDLSKEQRLAKAKLTLTVKAVLGDFLVKVCKNQYKVDENPVRNYDPVEMIGQRNEIYFAWKLIGMFVREIIEPDSPLHQQVSDLDDKGHKEGIFHLRIHDDAIVPTKMQNTAHLEYRFHEIPLQDILPEHPHLDKIIKQLLKGKKKRMTKLNEHEKSIFDILQSMLNVFRGEPTFCPDDLEDGDKTLYVDLCREISLFGRVKSQEEMKKMLAVRLRNIRSDLGCSPDWLTLFENESPFTVLHLGDTILDPKTAAELRQMAIDDTM